VFAAASAWFAMLAVICVALLIRRTRIGGSRWRRQRTLIAVVAVVAVSGGAAVLTLNAFNQSTRHSFGWLLYVVIYVITLVLPVAFVVGLLRDRAGYASVADLVRGLDQIETRELEAGLAKTLQDPAMKLVFPVGGAGAFVDVEGHPVLVPDDGTRRVTMLGPNDAPVAALIHDPAVLESPKLLQAASAAAHLALSNARLQAEVRAQLSEVKSSRVRIIAAADEERRRIERNLPDGAQQHLLGMGMTLHLLRSQLDDYAAATETLDDAESALRQAIEELRELAQGIHPAVLTDEGLLAAVGLLARRSPIAVRIDAEVDTRPAPNVEAAAYYIISEALQNIAKHAHAQRASVRLRCLAGHLDIKVTDDGVGGVLLQAGSGLRGMADRTHALDGTFQIRSEPGTGTEVRVSLPCG
jgi:signal transduction histidine kinase